MYLSNKLKITCCLCIMIIVCRHTCCALKGLDASEYRTKDEIIGCSDRLSRFLFKLCDKTVKVIKRDTTSIMMEKLNPKNSWKRVRRQLATECCEHVCTISNIILYCSDEARLVQEDPDVFDY